VQQKWLSKVLGGSQAPWKIVMGHHPIYSSGEHGSSKSLMKALEPLLIEHQVDLYLAGHDHEYERFKPVQGVQHIVSGGGGAYLRNFEKPLPSSLVRVKAHHFLSFEATPTVLKMQAIDKTGQVIDQTGWQKDATPKTQKKNLGVAL
jgi:tartrate-resistant acid phosphatase type 5